MSEDAKPIALMCESDFNCPQDWDKLEPTDEDGTRFCATCKKEVTYCYTEKEVMNLAMSGECVAFSVPLLRWTPSFSGGARGIRISPRQRAEEAASDARLDMLCAEHRIDRTKDRNAAVELVIRVIPESQRHQYLHYTDTL